jgi:beta-glucanase (GH16 family)
MAGSTATLTFDDDFNSLNLWNGTIGTWYTNSYGSGVSGNGFSPSGEQEWYINNNYAPTASVTPWTVNNGILTITAAAASSDIQPLINGYQYTSGEITTSQSFSQTYGFFEMRAELPAGQGTWPAFWLLDANGQWPPELDVMEELGKDPSTYYASLHWGSNWHHSSSSSQAISVPDTSTAYHTYGVDWEPNTITFYFDGHAVYQTATPSGMNQPMYMIANLALGGSWGGAVDPSVLPAQMDIDFIRAYSSLPSWIADGSDPTDVNHTPITTFGPSYVVPSSGVTSIVLGGAGPQTVDASQSLQGVSILSNNYGSTITGSHFNDTLVAGTGADILAGNGGSDTFVFNALPKQAGHITDFDTVHDVLDLSGIFNSIGYTSTTTSPLKGGYIAFVADGHGGTDVYIHPSGSRSAGVLVTDLDHVAPASVTSSDWIWHH